MCIRDRINPLNNALKQRDQALAQLYKDYKSLKDNVGASQGKQAEKDLEHRFTKIREEQGLPDNEIVNELMRDVYYSHEGDTLDQEYPDMLRKRWEGDSKSGQGRRSGCGEKGEGITVSLTRGTDFSDERQDWWLQDA